MPPPPPRRPPRPAGLGGFKMPTPRAPPKQLWSTRTMGLLATTVGSITYMLGLSQGYKAGKRKALEDVALGKAETIASLPPRYPPHQTGFSAAPQNELGGAGAPLAGEGMGR